MAPTTRDVATEQWLAEQEALKRADLRGQTEPAEKVFNEAREKYVREVQAAERERAAAIRLAKSTWERAIQLANRSYDALHPGVKPFKFNEFDRACRDTDKARDDAINKAHSDCAGKIRRAASAVRAVGFMGPL
jgi:hypothetical protein